jgi:hypothetical protein
MVLKNDRTQKILDLISKFSCADATHIQRLYYNYPYGIINCRKKLTQLVKEGTLKRKRNDINSKYVYWIGKEPAQINHALLILELYVLAVQKYGSVDCQLKGLDMNIRPDAFLKPQKGKQRFIEVHLSNNDLNLEKYLPVARRWVGAFPEVLVVTNKRVSVSPEVNSKINVVVTSIERMGEKI